MPALSKIIKFYKDCYQSDYKAIKINNYFSENVELQYHIISFEPVNGDLPIYAVDQEWGKVMDEALTLHSKERALYSGVFFLKGKMNVLGRSLKSFAPLYLFETNLLFEDDIYSIELDLSSPLINPSFLELLKTKDPDVNFTYDEFVDLFPSKLDFEGLLQLKSVFETHFPFIEIEGLDVLLDSDKITNDLKAIYLSRAMEYESKLVGSVSLGLIKKSKNSRGVINELESLSNLPIKSEVLNSLFNKSQEKKSSSKKRDIHVPASLSESQKQVFYSADSYNTTLVIGPPGTGKSFTIAALTTELISQGKSVLIASKNDQAGKVIGNKIENDFGLYGLVVKTAHGSYKRKLKTRLKNILNGIMSYRVERKEVSELKSSLLKINAEIDQLEQFLNTREKEEIKWGDFYYQHQNTFFNKFKSKWIEYKHSKRIAIWKIKDSIDVKNLQRVNKNKRYIQRNYNYHMYYHLVKKRSDVINLIHALSEKTGNLLQKRFHVIDFDLILKALPAWICNTSDVHNVLPLQENLFDVLIIDEASQCDIASTIPLIYRAKKIVVVGDPKQLRHITFLSKNQQALLLEKNGLDSSIPNYRTKSILDLVNESINNQDQVIFLNEHYRSTPDIIRFSNESFYSSQLKIMSSTPTSVLTQNLFLENVNGIRNKKGENHEEVNKVLSEINGIINSESLLSADVSQSIGVISPFRSQVDLLKKTIKEKINILDIKKHKILVGSPYHFQGEERDVILLSFAVDSDTHPSTFIYLNKEDVFNVSVTRARNKQIVYSSINYKLLNPEYLLPQYLDSIGKPVFTEKSVSTIHDSFANAVSEELESIGVDQILKSFPIAGVIVDLVVVKNNKTYCIDLIGYPGDYEEQFTKENMQMLHRMKHKIFFLPYSSWYLEAEKSKKNLAYFVSK